MIPFELTIKNYRPFTDEHPARLLFQDKHIALVGPNNAGKSALLKFIYEFKGIFGALSTPKHLHGFATKVDHLESPGSSQFSTQNNRALSFRFRIEAGAKSTVDQMLVSFGRDGHNTITLYSGSDAVEMPNLHEDRHSANIHFMGNDLQKRLTPLCEVFSNFVGAVYVGPFRNAIAVESRIPYFGVEVGKKFIAQFDELKTGTDLRSRRDIDALINEIGHAFSFKSLNIFASSNRDTLLVDDGAGSLPLAEVGAGLSQFIMLLFVAHVYKPKLMLIDEPELNLHPTLQTKLLEMLGERVDRIVFSTHSLGLARSAAQAIYLINKNVDGSSTVRHESSSPSILEMLGEMSYSGYLGIGAAGVLMVEGPTDIPVLRHFLALYDLRHLVMMVPLHGRNSIHAQSRDFLDEIVRGSTRVFALIDSEKQSEAAELESNRQAFIESCMGTGIQTHVLERRAIENYLTPAAVQAEKGAACTALGPYQRLRDIKPSWSKDENYVIARHMTRKDLDGTDLGKFLRRLADALNAVVSDPKADAPD